MKRYLLAILTFFILTFTAFADGTKQFMPNQSAEGETPVGKGNCYLALGSREGGTGPSRPFARYNSDGTSCDDKNRLYIRIDDCTTEKIYLGFGGILYNGGTYNEQVPIRYRIKMNVNDDPDIEIAVDNGLTDVEKSHGDFVVYGGTYGFDVPKSSGENGYIEDYAQAYYGPNVVDSRGYKPIEVTVPHNGLYYLEFYIGSNIGCKDCQPVDFQLFDVSVVKTEGDTHKQVDGRIYSRAWGLNTNKDTNEAWSTFYTYSTDHYTSKVYLGGVRPYRFVFACNSYGSIKTSSVEENRQSFPHPAEEDPTTNLPEYKIFTTSPDTKFYGEAALPVLPRTLKFAGDAMTCEDLIFVIQLAKNEDATIELYLNNTESGSQDVDKVLIDVLKSEDAEARGYHYPWKDSVYVDKDIPGGAAGTHYYSPIAEGCTRNYKLSLFDQRYTYTQSGTSKVMNVGDSIDFEWLESNFIDWNEPLGSEKNPILISTKEELEALATAVNTGNDYTYTIKNFFKNQSGFHDCPKTFTIENEDGFSGVNFYLVAPTGTIELDRTWQGIGTSTKPFSGTFRCGKYQPDPAHLTNDDNGLIGDQDTITFTNATHGLFNNCKNATIDNIHIKGDFSLSIAPNLYSFTEHSFGGICSYANNTNINNCSNNAEIKASSATLSSSAEQAYVGGIIGNSQYCTIDSCYNIGQIETQYNPGSVGGIIGFTSNTTINFCYNIGSINMQYGKYSGGIIGEINDQSNIPNTTVTYCHNKGFIHSGTASSGIVGLNNDSNITISDCLNNGDIKGNDKRSKVAGIVGECTKAGKSTILYCLNTGKSNGSTAFAFSSNEANDTKYSLSTGTPKQYILENIMPIETTPTIGSGGLSEDHFYEEEDGTIDHLLGTACNGGTWRMEEAGRLYQNDTTFYLTWDGKFDDGDCVTGDVTVNYQKNTGVTHFPFFDPENINFDNTTGKRGLVVYRISPIEDSLKTSASYVSLPKNYYQTSNFEDSEKGIEMKLYWDDRKIASNNNATCTITEINADGKAYTIGKSVDAVNETVIFDNPPSGAYQKRCIEGKYKPSYCKTQKKLTVTENGKTVTKYYCATWQSNHKNACEDWDYTLTRTSEKNCIGIENVSEKGYFGSVAGGHIFPISEFGNNNIMNTWWNGIEVQGVNILTLKENNPAVLMPIVLTRWTATNLSLSVLLEWTTASEENNNYFSIERSVDGVNWERIGKVHGAGTTSMTHSYSFEDTKPISGISYYRLKQTDYNEDYSYSSVICINRPSAEQESYIAYTNAETNTFIVEGNSIAACPIELYDILGHKIYNISFNSISTSKVAINVGKLPAGSYIIKSCNKSKTVVKNW